jgi:hypothetical protein
LTEIIRREIEGVVAKQSGLTVTPAKVTAVREDYLRADVKLMGNGAEIKAMLNKTAEKLTVGQTVTVAYSTLPSSGVILLANGEADLIKEGGGWEVDTAVLLDSANIHDWVAVEELMTDISANTKLLYGGHQKMVSVQGYACQYSTSALDDDDADKFGTKIELDAWYRENAASAYVLRHYVIEMFVNEISTSTSGGVTTDRYVFGLTISRYVPNGTTAENTRAFYTGVVANPSDAFIVLRVNGMGFETEYSKAWSGTTQTVSTPYGYIQCNNMTIRVGTLTEASPTAVTFPSMYPSGSSSSTTVYLNVNVTAGNDQYRCVPLDSNAEKFFDMALTKRSEPTGGDE